MDHNIVGIVNGQPLSMSEFDRQKQILKESYAQQYLEWNEEQMSTLLLDHLIGQTLMMQEAEKEGFVPSSETIDEKINDLKSQFPTEENFHQALASQNLTLEQLRSDISQEVSINGYLGKMIPKEEITATEEEIFSLYQQYKVNVGGRMPTLEEIKPQLERMIVQQKAAQAINRVVEKLKAQSEIELFI
ncbi:MAG: hypothetical protein GX351_06795 [Peptococcaceae bacterium]|nr:hypothetical protein [Peptococcaceae bacterium]